MDATPFVPARVVKPVPEVAVPCARHAHLQQLLQEMDQRQMAAMEELKDGMNGKQGISKGAQ